MPTRELPRLLWAHRLDEFTLAHEGWLVSIDVLGDDIGAQPELNNLPLLGVSADRIDHDGTITISAARSATEHVTHVLHAVRRIFLDGGHDGGDVVLEFESEDGTRTIVRCRAHAMAHPAH